MLDRSPLTTLLTTAIAKKPALAFYAGYQDTLAAINRGGQFNLAGLELRCPVACTRRGPVARRSSSARTGRLRGLVNRLARCLNSAVGRVR
jgi:hypothetical protein